MPLFLALDMRGAPGELRAAGSVSEFVLPGRSLLAGCSQSVDVSEVALLDILEAAHAAYRPLAMESWVDVLSQRHVERSDVFSPNKLLRPAVV